MHDYINGIGKLQTHFKSQKSVKESKIIIDTAFSNRICIDTHHRFHNIFFYEICPLLKVAEHVCGTHLHHIGENDRIDGTIILKNGRKQFVEITSAVDGRQDALRMELLHERGDAPAIQDIEAEGRQGDRKFGKNQLVAVSNSELDGKRSDLIEAAIRRKLNKSNINKKYDGAWLVVVFDDWIPPPPSVPERGRRFDKICVNAIDKIGDDFSPFLRVFIVGVTRTYIFDRASCRTERTVHPQNP